MWSFQSSEAFKQKFGAVVLSFNKWIYCIVQNLFSFNLSNINMFLKNVPICRSCRANLHIIIIPFLSTFVTCFSIFLNLTTVLISSARPLIVFIFPWKYEFIMFLTLFVWLLTRVYSFNYFSKSYLMQEEFLSALSTFKKICCSLVSFSNCCISLY